MARDDLVVIGSGPAGQKAAIAAAKMGMEAGSPAALPLARHLGLRLGGHS